MQTFSDFMKSTWGLKLIAQVGKRIFSECPKFFAVLRNLSGVVLICSQALANYSITLTAEQANLISVACAVAMIISQLTVEGGVQNATPYITAKPTDALPDDTISAIPK